MLSILPPPHRRVFAPLITGTFCLRPLASSLPVSNSDQSVGKDLAAEEQEDTRQKATHGCVCATRLRLQRPQHPRRRPRACSRIFQLFWTFITLGNYVTSLVCFIDYNLLSLASVYFAVLDGTRDRNKVVLVPSLAVWGQSESWWYAGQRTYLHSSHRKASDCGKGRRGRHGLIIFSLNGKSVLTTAFEKPQDRCAGIFYMFCAPHLFQDGFSHRWLVGKAAQEELSQLDCKVGKEGEVSYDIWGETL